MGEQRNLFIAVAIMLVGLFVYQYVVVEPAARSAREQQALEAASTQDASVGEGASSLVTGRAESMTREEALALSPRVNVRTPELLGSIALTGARIDDLHLTTYREEVEADSDTVTLFSPERGPHAYFAFNGWSGPEFPRSSLPNENTEWRLVSAGALTPETPISLEYTSPEGMKFERRIAVDEHYMFTVTDRVTNGTGADATIAPSGAVRRHGLPDEKIVGMVHQGLIGVFGNALHLRKFKRMQKDREFAQREVGGWLGITDKYWLAAAIPAQSLSYDGAFLSTPTSEGPLFEARWQGDGFVLAADEVIETTSRTFAGAKRADLLRDYKDTLGITKFDWAIDWGKLFFLTQPFFLLLDYFAKLTGSFGVAILLLTVCVKIATFPLANTSFKSMARMKQLQPKVQELREKYKADAQRQQQEMMKLYQREKVNPLAGCLPMIVQIPIFFALYKTLFVTIEMRHAPFFGWIDDLSAPDPTNIWNLFGLLPYDPASIPLLGLLIGGVGFLALGALPLIYGISMAAMQTLNPPPPDPTQQKIFAFMPWVFMFVLAQFAAGLLIYWIWNNILSFAQQYAIMRRQGVDTPIGSFIAKRVAALRAKLASGGGG